jgi:hypothetical protein
LKVSAPPSVDAQQRAPAPSLLGRFSRIDPSTFRILFGNKLKYLQSLFPIKPFSMLFPMLFHIVMLRL